MQIVKETDLTKFKTLAGNRSLNERHVADLANSIVENGYRSHEPITVNKHMEVVDGQHRLEAAKLVGSSVTYVVADDAGNGVSDAVAMNVSRRNWTKPDYAASYAKSGNENYKNLLSLIKRHPKVYMSAILVAASPDPSRAITARDFRAGLLELDDNYELTDVKLDMLDEYLTIRPELANSATQHAFFYAMYVPGFDHERMLKKLNEVGKSEPHNKLVDSIRQLEAIYNRGYQLKDITRFV